MLEDLEDLADLFWGVFWVSEAEKLFLFLLSDEIAYSLIILFVLGLPFSTGITPRNFINIKLR